MFPVVLMDTVAVPEALTVMVTQLFTTLGTVATTVTANPVMCIGLAATVGGIAIGWFKSMTGQRRRKGR